MVYEDEIVTQPTDRAPSWLARARERRGGRRHPRRARRRGGPAPEEDGGLSYAGTAMPACCNASSKSWRLLTACIASATETVPSWINRSSHWSNVTIP